MAILWNELMSTGVPKIDEQHKELIEALNTLGNAMQAGKGKDEIEKILEFAGQYARKHFGFEEECFEKYNCPAAALNKQEHAWFVERFTVLMEEFQEKGARFSLIIKIHKELSHWLLQHICEVDMKLRPYVQKT